MNLIAIEDQCPHCNSPNHKSYGFVVHKDTKFAHEDCACYSCGESFTQTYSLTFHFKGQSNKEHEFIHIDKKLRIQGSQP